MTMLRAAIPPPEPVPATMRCVPVVMSRTLPVTWRLSVEEAEVITVTGAPPGVVRTRLLPFTRSSIPEAAASPGHPLTAVSSFAVPPAWPAPPGRAISPYQAPPATKIAAAAPAITACHLRWRCRNAQLRFLARSSITDRRASS
jgi:hypothetical protein